MNKILVKRKASNRKEIEKREGNERRSAIYFHSIFISHSLRSFISFIGELMR